MLFAQSLANRSRHWKAVVLPASALLPATNEGKLKNRPKTRQPLRPKVTASQASRP